MDGSFWWMIAIIVAATMAFIPAIAWVDNHRREREAHYRNEMAKRIADASDSSPLMAFVRETERIDAERVRMKFRVAGLIVSAVGVALMIFLSQAMPGGPAYLVGLLPLAVGSVLLLVSELILKPRDDRRMP
ncbi:MAG: hypothetical protein AAF525_02275 [Pseudomonadota bacterium]